MDPDQDRAALAAGLSLGYPVLFDGGLRVTRAYGAQESGKDHPGPAVYVLDAEHRVVFRHLGKNAADRPSTEAVLNALGR